MALARASRGARGRVFAVVALLATTLTLVIGSQPASAAAGIEGEITATPPRAPAGRTIVFSGSITNTGNAPGNDDFTSVTIEDDGSTGLGPLTISPVGPLAADNPDPVATFTVTATVIGAVGDPVRLRLKATGVTAVGADPVDDVIDSAALTVVEAISGTITTEPPRAPAGRTVTFQGTITNNGTTAADDFTSVAIVNDGSTGLGPLTITPVGPVAAGATSAPFTVTAPVTGAVGTPVVLRLRATGVTASASDTNPVDDTIDSAELTVVEAITATVTTVAPASAPFGKNLTFEGTVTNNGTELTDAFAPVLVENDGSTGLTVNPAILPLVGPGQTVPFTVTTVVNATPGNPAQLHLKATGITVVGPDPVDDTVDTPAIAVTEAVELTVVAERKQLTDANFAPCPAVCTVSIHDRLRYTMTVRNVSDVAADVTVTGDIPTGTSNVTTVNPPTTLTIGAGQTRIFTREVTIDDDRLPGQVISFTGSATYDASAGGVTLTGRSAAGSPVTREATVVDPLLDISYDMVDENGGDLVRGDVVRSTVTVQNTGNKDATDTVVEILLNSNLRDPGDFEINGSPAAARGDISGNTLTARIGAGADNNDGGTLAVGSGPVEITFTATVINTPTAPLVARGEAEVSFAGGGINPKNAFDQITILGQPQITLGITGAPAAPGPVQRDSNIVYTVTISNAAGVATATGVQVSFPIPAQTTYVSSSASAGGTFGVPNPTAGPNATVIVSFPSIAAGTSKTLTVTVHVVPGASQVPPPPVTDPPTDPSNDIVATASATFGPGANPPAPPARIAHELAVAQLSVTNVIDDRNDGIDLIAGETVDSTVRVTNVGSADAGNTQATITLTNLENVSGVAVGATPLTAGQFTIAGNQLIVPLGTLNPTEENVITFSATVVTTIPAGTPTAHTSASVAFQNGGVSPQVAPSNQIAVKNQPNVTLAITAIPPAGASVPRGGEIIYQVTATNSTVAANVATATNVQITFPIPAQTTLVTDAGSPSVTSGGSFVSGNPIVATFPTQAAGANATLTVKVLVSPTATKVDGPANDIVADADVTYGPGAKTADAPDIGHEVKAADLALSITPPPPPPPNEIQKKKPFLVTVEVENLGPDGAAGTKTVTITLTGPGRIVAAPSSCTVVDPARVQATCTITTELAALSSVSFPITVQADQPSEVRVDASLTTTGVEIDPDTLNDDPVFTILSFRQSDSDLSITNTTPGGLTPALNLVLLGAPQDLVYTVATSDPPGPNGNDPSEVVRVTITIPTGFVATAAVVANGVNSCTLGVAVICDIGDVNVGSPATVTVSVQATGFPLATGLVTATAQPQSSNDANQTNNTALPVLLAALPQPVDLSVSNGLGNVVITTSAPGNQTATRDFTVTVTNNAPLLPVPFTATSYTVTITGGVGVTLVSANAACVTSGVPADDLTCTGSNLGAGVSAPFLITAITTNPDPVTVTAVVALNETTGQDDQNDTNDTASGTIERNLPPLAVADVGPTVPVAVLSPTTLLYEVLDNDSDGDGDDLTVTTPGVAGLTVDVVSDPAPGPDKQLRVVVPEGTAPNTTFDIPYTVSDNRGIPVGVDSVNGSLKVRVVGPISEQVAGSFKSPPAEVPNSFGVPIPADLLDDTKLTPLDLFAGQLGESAAGAAFPADVTHAVTDATGPKVIGTVVVPAGGGTVDYTPPPGYTSDDEISAPAPQSTPPADRFSYKTTGTRSSRTLFTVDTSARVEVTNQNPIGVDMLFDVTNLATQDVKPAADSIDGNRDATIGVTDPPNTSFVFDDEGTADPQRRLRISCIGVLTPDQLDADRKPLATVRPDDVCPSDAQGVVQPVAGWQKAGGGALVLRPEGASGDATAKLLADSETVSLSADKAVAGEVDFHFVVTDVRGGAGFGKTTVKVPNTPPEVIEGVRTVLKNTPTVVVDTKLAATDNNQDVIIVSGTSTRTEHGTSVISTDKRVITYTPDRDYLGPDKLFYNVSDQKGGAAFAELQLNVIEQPSVLDQTLGAGTPAGAGPAGNLAATGGDPLPLTAAAGACMVLGLLFVQAGRRRQSRPLLDGARHLRQ